MIPSTNNQRPIWQEENGEGNEFPLVPVRYTLRAAPVPLISANDGRWIARVVHEESDDEGILIYEDDHEIIFLTADETAMSLAYLLREAWNLIPEVNPTLSTLHARAVEQMRSLWWMEETRKARALVKGCLDEQEEAQA